MSDEVVQLTTLESMEEFPVNQPQSSPQRIAKDILAGTTGGIAQVLVGQPFDTTKVRLQTSTRPTGVLDVIRNLVREEGPRAFYKGTLTPLIGCGLCVSVQFGVNESMKRLLHSRHPNRTTLSLPEYYLCGLTGGFTNSFLASPIEHVRIRLQTQRNQKIFNGPVDCIKKLIENGALMRGLPVMMLRAGHGLGCYFLVYEALVSREIHNGIKRIEIPAWKLCGFGAIAGTVLWVAIYPLDVIKSVIQTDKLKNPVYKNSMVKVAKSLYAKEGAMAFFKGFVPTILRASPVNAATFLSFECAMRLMG
ncbi:similar to Saccharomyces cerevisiae YBR104W YMC2 Mitochondrial protein, putative inner membrane transporter with a role in oleate metabolism and glutamate biosynthesis [Maudiozyma barnettii]|uniref:Similar to Saccharomyces cerevisiae YBR104W YMC2 Mitochondrial protein, putative inner membrane transporter with a role in oleate metabolism and glutamate biosynthesis n=1 Tax=Maudiozyma barnettii TaxID=61262 RepID=A0A8H2VAZ2_9SACH|nr:uncharacterized protein KABA2_01S02266 [Kazachstania barnettii]CAB4251938.1 similar to Saccharomyces cerevisiae YBR104W YMC2 Mitochondrial protein, putative inner membrane transporter with a role in oleate metabolism and glutamate biosynthesis [Kazachstania barnettii]CAD1778297.1 similar to Saccharomyces cerevisiae YBR104W YMC2 Mitochondrial protein, putative inner membrane transporter with a role in oleate metabolism and glutamate biosynthesis [Kazachstania barnettii]